MDNRSAILGTSNERVIRLNQQHSDMLHTVPPKSANEIQVYYQGLLSLSSAPAFQTRIVEENLMKQVEVDVHVFLEDRPVKYEQPLKVWSCPTSLAQLIDQGLNGCLDTKIMAAPDFTHSFSADDIPTFQEPHNRTRLITSASRSSTKLGKLSISYIKILGHDPCGRDMSFKLKSQHVKIELREGALLLLVMERVLHSLLLPQISSNRSKVLHRAQKRNSSKVRSPQKELKAAWYAKAQLLNAFDR